MCVYAAIWRADKPPLKDSERHLEPPLTVDLGSAHVCWSKVRHPVICTCFVSRHRHILPNPHWRDIGLWTLDGSRHLADRYTYCNIHTRTDTSRAAQKQNQRGATSQRRRKETLKPAQPTPLIGSRDSHRRCYFYTFRGDDVGGPLKKSHCKTAARPTNSQPDVSTLRSTDPRPFFPTQSTVIFCRLPMSKGGCEAQNTKSRDRGWDHSGSASLFRVSGPTHVAVTCISLWSGLATH